MKKLLVFVFLTVALALAADNYHFLFNAWLSDGKFQLADSILDVWRRARPDDPELYPARFNLLLNRAHSEMLVLSGESAQKGDQLVLADSTGHAAGYLYSEVRWQDSLVDEALTEISRGIVACPDRIDFRLGKAAAAAMAGRWSAAVDAVDGLLDRDRENGGVWLGSENAAQTNADTLIAAAVFERLCDIYNSDSRAVVESAMPLADRAAKRFGKDARILNIAGGMYIGVGKVDSALMYFEEAVRIAPDDALPLTNIAYITYQQGDTARALEIYRRIEQGDYDEESRNVAGRMIAEITAPVEDMQEYYYFFRYLPQIAAQVEDVAEFMDVEMFNTSIPAYNKCRSPFADSDIKADSVRHDGEPKVVVWTFPMPEQIPLCRYVAFVADSKGTCKVWTLEKSLDGYWVVGTMEDDSHANFGDTPYPDDAAAFVKALRQKNLLK